MPWFIRQSDSGQYCVVAGTKEKPEGNVKCHKTRAAAVKHLRALYVNVEDASDNGTGGADGMGVNALRALHDRLLAERPEGAVHDEDACPLCGSDDDTEGGWMATFSEEELQAAVDAAVNEATAPLKSRIAELETQQQRGEVDAATAELKDKIAELESKLDAAVLEASQAKEEKENLQKAWDDEKAAEAAAKELAARREERLEKVREVASFPDEYLEANADRFAAMDEEEFLARIEEWKTLTAKSEDGVPKKTALTAARHESNGGGDSQLNLLREFRRTLTDPRTL